MGPENENGTTRGTQGPETDTEGGGACPPQTGGPVLNVAPDEAQGPQGVASTRVGPDEIHPPRPALRRPVPPPPRHRLQTTLGEGRG